jgi:transcriptional regulator with XRE-family HTH domain
MTNSRHTSRYRRLLKALREARKSAKITQGTVASHFGAHASFISKIESGERRVDVVELAELCQIYGVKLSAFIKQIGLE